MKHLLLVLAFTLSCSAIDDLPPIESAVRLLNLRNSPPPRLYVLDYPVMDHPIILNQFPDMNPFPGPGIISIPHQLLKHPQGDFDFFQI